MLDIDSVMFYLATIFGGSLKIKPHEASIGSRNYGQVDSSDGICDISLIYTQAEMQRQLPGLVMNSRLLINFSQFVMLAVDKYDKYTSQQIYTPRSWANHPRYIQQQARFLQASTFLFATEFNITIDAKHLRVSFLMQIYLL